MLVIDMDCNYAILMQRPECNHDYDAEVIVIDNIENLCNHDLFSNHKTFK